MKSHVKKVLVAVIASAGILGASACSDTGPHADARFVWEGTEWAPTGGAREVTADAAITGFCGVQFPLPGDAKVVQYVPGSPAPGNPKAELVVFTEKMELSRVVGSMHSTPNCVVSNTTGSPSRAAFERVLLRAPHGDADRWWLFENDGQVSGFRVSYSDHGKFTTSMDGPDTAPIWDLLAGIPVEATGTPVPPVSTLWDDSITPSVEELPDLNKTPKGDIAVPSQGPSA